MPEHPEIETEEIQESIHEELEKEGGGFLRRVALTTAVFAALAAMAALQAGHTVNEALVLKTEAARLETGASDQWAYYQAKGIKLTVEQAAAALCRALGKTPPAELAASAKRYQYQQETSRRAAQALEARRDAESREGEELLHRHHFFADAVALFQVAIALGAVSALTRMRWLWMASLLLGLVGAATFALPFVR